MKTIWSSKKNFEKTLQFEKKLKNILEQFQTKYLKKKKKKLE